MAPVPNFFATQKKEHIFLNKSFNMKVISSKVHGILDYATVIFLLLSPTMFDMQGNLAIFTYALGCIHFLLTILTAFEVGLIKVIPFRLHGLIEIVVAIALVGVAFWFRSQDSGLGYHFYLAMAVVILLVFTLTDFSSAGRRV